MLAALALFALLTPLQGQVGEPSAEVAQARLQSLAEEVDSQIPWIRDPYARVDLHRRSGKSQPYSPPVDRIALLEQGLAQAKARGQLLLVYAHRIEGRQMYRAPLLDHYMRLAVWGDPETAELVRRRFVPMRLYVDKAVGAKLGVVNGKREEPGFLATVEPALLFVTPSGDVVHIVERIRSFSPYWMRTVLLRVLARQPKHAALSPEFRALDQQKMQSAEARAWLAEQMCLEGRELDALELLRKPAPQAKQRPLPDAKGNERLAQWVEREKKKRAEAAERGERALARSMMRAERLRGEAPAALRMLGESEALADEALRSVLALDELSWASRLLTKLPERSEFEWWRGYLAWRAWKLDAARAHFARAAQLAEQPWAGRAAAMLVLADDTTPISPLAHGFEMVRYPPAAAQRGPLPRTSELASDDAESAARAGLRWLLGEQRPDGSWSDTRYAYWGSPEILPNVRAAVTALSAAALVRWRSLDPNVSTPR